MDGDVRLDVVTPADRGAIAALELGQDQHDFVASNRESLAEARRDPDARPRAIHAGDRLVGFLMYEAPEDDDEATIYRFMIDQSVQGRGYGRAALRCVLDEIRSLPHVARVSICYMPQNVAARRLYGSAGFIETGLDEDGEMIAHLDFPRRGKLK